MKSQHARASLGASQRTARTSAPGTFRTEQPSFGPAKPWSWRVERDGADSPLAGAASPTNEPFAVGKEKPAPWWWAPIDSGLLGSSLFLVAMMLYVWCIPLGQSTRESDWVLQSQLWLIAALLFVIESSIDLFWGLKRWVVEASAARNKRALKELMSRYSASPPSSISAVDDKEKRCAPWLDDVRYDVWAALFFVIPSLFYTFSSLLDPNVVVWSWLNVLRGSGWSDAEYSVLCSKIATCLFVFDAMIGMTGRWSYRRTTPEEEQLTLVQFWKVSGPFELDWAAWGDFLFFLGSLVGIVQQFAHYSVPLDFFTQILWTCDALFYCIGCWPTFISLLRDRDDGAVEP